jgi:prepilin-type processing-associated H-X9-DG protein
MKVQSTTPVMWEWPGHHKPLGGMRPGGNVLYMDGRVEYVPMGEFPMTEEAFEVLRELDALGP